jgi:hypothetical protein
MAPGGRRRITVSEVIERHWHPRRDTPIPKSPRQRACAHRVRREWVLSRSARLSRTPSASSVALSDSKIASACLQPCGYLLSLVAPRSVKPVDHVSKCENTTTPTCQRDVRMIERVFCGHVAKETITTPREDGDHRRAASRYSPGCYTKCRPKSSILTRIFARRDLPSYCDIAACVVQRQRDWHIILALSWTIPRG